MEQKDARGVSQRLGLVVLGSAGVDYLGQTSQIGRTTRKTRRRPMFGIASELRGKKSREYPLYLCLTPFSHPSSHGLEREPKLKKRFDIN